MIRPPIEDPDMPLSDVMMRWPETIPVFFQYRMLCVGCHVASFHTVIDACLEHGAEETAFREELAQAIGVKPAPH